MFMVYWQDDVCHSFKGTTYGVAAMDNPDK
jgi:hypothetical protein